jgi:hypothetical protein
VSSSALVFVWRNEVEAPPSYGSPATICRYSSLFCSETDGSSEHLVLRGAGKRGFVVAEDRICYLLEYLLEQTVTSKAIRVFLLRNGEGFQIVRVPQPLIGGLSLSPDGRYVI